MQHWFESYLSNMNYLVLICLNQKLQFLYVKHYTGCSTRIGVGQSTFYFVYNDMYRPSNQMRFVHFADDITVSASDSYINNAHATVNTELVGVYNWLKTNRLSVNVSKTSYMMISNQKNAIYIRIRNLILTKVSTVRF